MDRISAGGGILIFVRESITAVELRDIPMSEGFEGISIELNFNNKKWFLLGTYNPSKTNLVPFLFNCNKILEHYTTKYENIIVLGDFNIEESDSKIKDFMIEFGLKNLIKEKTCYKSPKNPSYIDLILTNKPRSFKTALL